MLKMAVNESIVHETLQEDELDDEMIGMPHIDPAPIEKIKFNANGQATHVRALVSLARIPSLASTARS